MVQVHLQRALERGREEIKHHNPKVFPLIISNNISQKKCLSSDFAAGSLSVIFFEVFTLWLDVNYFTNVHRSLYFIEVSKESGHNLFLF